MVTRLPAIPARHVCCLLAAGILFLFAVPATANPDLYAYLSGTYVVVGKRPDSEIAYSGSIDLVHKDGGLVVEGTVGSTKRVGSATLEKALHGGADVLRMRFSEGGVAYEAIYLFSSDLDNYARLTGYVFRSDDTTKSVGLEALFPDHGTLRRD